MLSQDCVLSYLSINDKVRMNAFVISQFASSPLIGMFVDRTLNSKINAMHFRALKIVYRDNVSTFDELLKRDNSVRVHHRNIQFVAIEMFKVKLGIAPSFMNDIFQKRLVSKESVVCALRSQSEFYNYNNPRTVLYGTETMRCLGQKYGKFCRTVSKHPATLKSLKKMLKNGFQPTVLAVYVNHFMQA